MARIWIQRSKPFRVFILPIRSDKLCKVPPGEIHRQAQDRIEAALQDGNSEGEVDLSGVVYKWQEWDEFENDMRMKELAELIQESFSSGRAAGIPHSVLEELVVLIRDGID